MKTPLPCLHTPLQRVVVEMGVEVGMGMVGVGVGVG